MSQFHIVDVFATEKYAGNQLAVVMDAAGYSTEDMQRITREFDFSETTFVTGETAGGFDTRIFTPESELPFAGHPTLGTAWILRELSGGDRVDLNLGVGRTPVVFERGDAEDSHGQDIGWLTPPTPELGPRRSREEAAAALSLDVAEISPDFPVEIVTAGIPFVLVPLASIDALHRLRLDVAVHENLIAKGLEAVGFLAFCLGSHTGNSEIASRMVWQAHGSSREDPATGSATACLGGYALAHGFATNEHQGLEVRVEQGFEMGRPSLLRIRGETSPDGVTLEVGGSAFEVARGELLDK